MFNNKKRQVSIPLHPKGWSSLETNYMENNYLDKFKKLPHLGIDYDVKKLPGLPWGCKVIDDWGYAPNLYHFDTEWHVSWIHCSEGDGILDFHFTTPEECINRAYEFCINNHLISES